MTAVADCAEELSRQHGIGSPSLPHWHSTTQYEAEHALERIRAICGKVHAELKRQKWSRRTKAARVLAEVAEDYERMGRRLEAWLSDITMERLGVLTERPDALLRHAEARVKREPTPSWIYFVRSFGQVKIGHAKNPAARVRTMQIGSRHPLRLVAMIPGGQEKEAELHKRFAKDRAAGEWFRITDELTQFIAEASAHAA
jgi:hypothetical protein